MVEQSKKVVKFFIDRVIQNSIMTNRWVFVRIIIMAIAVTLLGLGLVIFIHELGHLVAAKRANVGVSEFAVGMGPKVVGFVWRNTQYSLRLLPFGGFIRVRGLDDLDPCPIEDDYRLKPKWQKAMILAAGSIMNIVLGFIIYTGIALTFGHPTPIGTVYNVKEASPAFVAGVQSGDEWIAINDIPLGNLQPSFISWIHDSEGVPFTVTFVRDTVVMTVDLSAEKDSAESPYRIGVIFDNVYMPYSIIQSLSVGFNETLNKIGQSFLSIKLLLTGDASISDLAGPVGIVQLASNQFNVNILAFLNVMAFISISLGVINMMPLPVLDGGHLLFLIIEALRGKPLQPRVETILTTIATVCLISIMAFGVVNDVISWDDRTTLLRQLNP
jgi:regulator of sigma E protease